MSLLVILLLTTQIQCGHHTASLLNLQLRVSENRETELNDVLSLLFERMDFAEVDEQQNLSLIGCSDEQMTKVSKKNYFCFRGLEILKRVDQSYYRSNF